MSGIRARVQNGRLVIDEPTDLPEGTVLDLVADDAERHASTIDRWWRVNRPAAPDLFRDEFAAALELIGLAPFAGRPYRKTRVSGVRRVLLRSTRHHVDYVVRETDALVVAAWGAIRETGPNLGA